MAALINATNRADYLRFCMSKNLDPAEQKSKSEYQKSLAPASDKVDLRAGRKPAGEIDAFFYDANGDFVTSVKCKDTVNGRMSAVISAVQSTKRPDLLDATSGGSVIYTKPAVQVILEDGKIVSGPRVVATFNLATGEQISGAPMASDDEAETEEMAASAE